MDEKKCYKYEKPVFIVINSKEIKNYIHAHAKSNDGCGYWGCPDPKNYQSGAGCGHLYSIGGCDEEHNT